MSISAADKYFTASMVEMLRNKAACLESFYLDATSATMDEAEKEALPLRALADHIEALLAVV